MVNPCEEATHIIWDETGEAVIIDCGVFYRNERENLLAFIKQEQLRPVSHRNRTLVRPLVIFLYIDVLSISACMATI